ncbi:MAG: class I SAM-dependent methyltransferase [Kiritimatiellae bacterium]|nr:class I SAM-dependent methyltransferase [Kiritimatiellia bacterium]
MSRILPFSSGTVVDAPCGDGIVTFWLQRFFPSYRFELYDISPAHTRTARRLLPAAVSVTCTDLSAVPVYPSTDVWLLINSLYLFTDAEYLVERMKTRMAFVIGVFPHLDHPNYRCYFRRFPHLSNPSARDEKQTIRLFEGCGYRLIAREICTFIPFHCFAIPGLNVISTRLFNVLDPLFSTKSDPCYWLGVFQRY